VSRRVEKVVGYPPLFEMGALQRQELYEVEGTAKKASAEQRVAPFRRTPAAVASDEDRHSIRRDAGVESHPERGPYMARRGGRGSKISASSAARSAAGPALVARHPLPASGTGGWRVPKPATSRRQRVMREHRPRRTVRPLACKARRPSLQRSRPYAQAPSRAQVDARHPRQESETEPECRNHGEAAL
jgi:hypothetical protein